MSRSARTWAPGGKLTAEQVAAVRRGEDLGGLVTARQLTRIRSGDCWPEGWQPLRREEAERKTCPICGVTFGRRYPSGRTRSATQWAQKVTCSHSCCLHARWQAGTYGGRGTGKKA